MLVPHKITALEQSNDPNVNALNTVVGAVVVLLDLQGQAVLLYDDEAGSNPSTAKTTDSSGQVVVWVAAGEYDEVVNGSDLRRVLVGNKDITTEQIIGRLRASQAGDVITATGFTIAGDGGGAQWKATATTGLTPSQAPADRSAAELVDGNGRLWELVLNGGVIRPSMLGAVPYYAGTAGANAQPLVQACLNTVKAGLASAVELDAMYYLSSSYDSNHILYIENVERVSIFGNGFGTGLVCDDSLINHAIGVSDASQFSVSNFMIRGRRPNGTSAGNRHINMTYCEDVEITNMLLDGSGRYSISHQLGTMKRLIINNIIFKYIGNDCIDIKNTEFSDSPANSTESFVISNLNVDSFGLNNLQGFPPHSVVDCRAPCVINNIFVRYMNEACTVVRLFGDAEGSQVSNIYCKDGVDPSTLSGIDRTTGVKLDGIAYRPIANKNTSISNIFVNGVCYGVRALEGGGKASITGGAFTNCLYGVWADNDSSDVSVAHINFDGCLDGCVKADAPNVSVSFCNAYNSPYFLEGSSATEKVRIAFNYVDDTIGTPWALPSSVWPESSIIGNTGKGSGGGSILRDRGVNVLKATSNNNSNTGFVTVQAGNNNVTVQADGALDDVNLSLLPKGNAYQIVGVMPEFSDNAAASSGGVPQGGLYRTGEVVKVRL